MDITRFIWRPWKIQAQHFELSCPNQFRIIGEYLDVNVHKLNLGTPSDFHILTFLKIHLWKMKSRLRYCSKSSDRFLNIIKRCFGNNPSQYFAWWPIFYQKLLFDILWFFLKPLKVQRRPVVYTAALVFSKAPRNCGFVATKNKGWFRMSMIWHHLKQLIRIYSA